MRDEGISHPLLSAMVSLVEEHESEVSITASVGGVWIGGTLVSGRKYFDAVATQFRTMGTGPEAETFAQAFENLAGELTMAEPGDGEDQGELRTGDPAVIFLRDAQAWVPGGHRSPPVPMSIKVGEIGAFFLGTMALEE